MEKKELKKRLNKTLKSNKSDLEKKIEILAVVTKALEKINVKPVIVGGQAVEFYTSGGYATMDIDMICAKSISDINAILEPLGFEKSGKYWVIEDNNISIVIEVPSGPLAGDKNKLTKVEVDEDLAAYFIGIEDIIIDRLNRYKHWKVYSDKEWIIGMIILNYDEIEWDYIYEKAKKERVIEELENFKQEAEEYDIE